MRIFVTGGAGYVGSHCVKDLCENGHEVVVFDNLSLGHREAVHPRAALIQGDLANPGQLEKAFQAQSFDAVMHFAASAEVGESVRDPLKYYRNNVANTLNLLEAMNRAGIRKMVFSSSCATYGIPPEGQPIVETLPQSPINPYGRTKLANEWMLRDSATGWGLGSCALRYFNACGAASDGSIGEDHDPESHIIPAVLQAALGIRPNISIFGTDYPTPDGTCIRDYIHVEDLASAHRLAIEAIQPGIARAFNVGTGNGFSVRAVIDAARRVTGRNFQVVEGPRRPGDPPMLVADPRKIQEELGWQPRWTEIDRIVESAWRWHSKHPNGFNDDPSKPAAAVTGEAGAPVGITS
jgi:UDP-glucose 4-epimerase